MHNPDIKKIPDEWKAHDRSIRSYLWDHRILSWTKKGIMLVLLLLFLNTGKFRQLDWLLNNVTVNGFYQWLLYFGILSIISELISLPFGVLHHRIERRHALSKQTYGSWFKDHLKGLALGAVLGTLTLGILYGCISYFPETWWIWACTLLVLLSIVLAQLTPIILIPLFFKLKPMDAGPLKERLMELCRRFRVHVEEVYHLGLGEKTEKGNAAFVGIGRTKRIIIGDTLYQKFTPEEVEAVFAHELGHQVHNDLWKGIILSSVFMFGLFFLTNSLANAYLFDQLETTILRPFGLLIFFLLLGLMQMPMSVIQAAYSRARERAADRFADETTKTGAKLADALERLTYQNRGQFKPNAIMEFFTYSHPAPWRRILSLR
jgi:STE24 endopeptidase